MTSGRRWPSCHRDVSVGVVGVDDQGPNSPAKESLGSGDGWRSGGCGGCGALGVGGKVGKNDLHAEVLSFFGKERGALIRFDVFFWKLDRNRRFCRIHAGLLL